jgi:hypothetical protein
VSGLCSVRPLRPPASLLHNAALPSVAASHYAKAPFGVAHRLRSLRVEATGVEQSCLRWRRSHSRRRFPVAGLPYAPPSVALVGVPAPWHQSGAARCAVGQWPAASHMVCAPAHPWASPLRGFAPALYSPSAPAGAPSVSAKPGTAALTCRYIKRPRRLRMLARSWASSAPAFLAPRFAA